MIQNFYQRPGSWVPQHRNQRKAQSNFQTDLIKLSLSTQRKAKSSALAQGQAGLGRFHKLETGWANVTRGSREGFRNGIFHISIHLSSRVAW